MENKNQEFNIDDPRYYIALELIFSYLSFREKVDCELVCKKWKTISRKINAKQEYFYGELKEIYEYETESWVSIDKFTKLFSKVPNLKGLMTDSLFPNINYFERLLEICPLIENFEFWDYDYVEGLDYTELGKLLNPRTKNLFVNYMRRFDLFTLMIDQMDQIEFFHGYYLNDYNFLFKFKKLKTLILWDLDMENGLLVVNGLINSGISETLEHLTLDIEYDYHDDEISKKICLKLAKHFPQLKTLNMANIKLFWPKTLNFPELEKFYYHGSEFASSMFNQNQFVNVKKIALNRNRVSVDYINGMSKVFPNLQILELILSDEDANHFDDESKMKLLKNTCNEMTKLNNLKYLDIYSPDLINLENETVCKEIFSAIKQMDSLNTIKFYDDLKDENIMEMFIEFAKCQPRKWIVFPSIAEWITTKFTDKDIPRNLSIRINEPSQDLEIIH